MMSRKMVFHGRKIAIGLTNAGPGPKLSNAGPPQNHLSGPPKKLFLDGDAKERAPKGRCQARGVCRHAPPQKILRNFTLFWRLFVRFEPLKLLSFNKV